MNVIEVENQFYILASSSFSDSRTEVLKQGESFGVFDLHGDIHQIGQNDLGLYHEGTRFLSELQVNIEGQRPLLLTSNKSENNEIHSVDLTNHDYPDRNGEMVLRGTIHILRNKFLVEGVAYERLRLINFGNQTLDFNLQVSFKGDFSDIFEARGTSRAKRGELKTPRAGKETIVLGYVGLDKILRETHIAFKPAPAKVQKNEASFSISLEPKEELDIDITMAFKIAGKKQKPLPYNTAIKERNKYNSMVKNNSAEIYTSNEEFNNWLERSKADMITMITQTPQGPYPYAGIPWYSTAFGRDGIITAFECLWVEPVVSKGVLKYLAHTQATEFNDFRDAEPGKILHETRGGEMAELGEIPFKQYYGTIDATPLFVCLAGAYLERTDDLRSIREIWPNIKKAMEWIYQYGDIDGDGFLEYATKSSKGLANQGWKDSHDSVFYKNGALAKGPIALCEVQGYAYDARIQAAKMAMSLGYPDLANKWRTEAEDLKIRFNEVFWSEEKQTYVIALDGEKKQCEIETSNAGHCLFSGIATPERARKVARSLVGQNMFSGWGIRTLSITEANYNPMSYHNGSIWPHDNAMAAYGFSRYGMQKETEKVLLGMFDTSTYVEERLPELFCGFDRRKGHGPTAYPVACSPQAWAVGAVYLLLQAMLGLKIYAGQRRICLYNPSLPSYLDEITITNLSIDQETLVALQIRKGRHGIEASILHGGSDISIEIIKKSLKKKTLRSEIAL